MEKEIEKEIRFSCLFLNLIQMSAYFDVFAWSEGKIKSMKSFLFFEARVFTFLFKENSPGCHEIQQSMLKI